MRYLCVLFFITHVLVLFGQPSKSQVNEAYQLFNNGDYAEAKELFEEIYEVYPRDAKYNFYYGACLVEVNENISLAAQCLKYASLKKVNKVVFYYLGRAYQLSYEFNIAIENFQMYLKHEGSSGVFKEEAARYIDQCEVGKRIASKIYKLAVIRKDSCLSNEVLNYYNPDSDIGKVMKNADFFEAGIDPEGIMFLTEREDKVFFSMKSQASADWDLYKMEHLIDGWSESALLGGEVNSSYNELYPMLHTDGVTLYFSSDRVGGLGGYDIYKATYDTQKKKFSNVINLGIPFNSPMDDYFFVCDDFSEHAWFVSNRETTGQNVKVYKIKWDNTVIKSFVEDNNELKKEAQLIAVKSSVSENGNTGSDRSNRSKVKSEKDNALFHFSVADTLEYTQFNHFKSEAALAEFRKGYDLVNKRDSLAQKMIEKRRLYSLIDESERRNTLVSEILLLEKKAYNIDGEIDDYYYQAQKLEQEKIKELVRSGNYKSSLEVRVTPKERVSISDINFPSNLVLYTNDDFGKRMHELHEMYTQLFNDDEVYKLTYSDSLFAWGNALNIESSRLLERATRSSTPTQVKIPIPFNRSKEEEVIEEKTSQSLVKQARRLRLDALRLYHQSLDDKFVIYRSKYRAFKDQLAGGEKYEQTMSYAGEALTYYKAGSEMINQSVVGIDLETFEKAGTYKRKAVQSQEKGLLYYIVEVKGGSTFADTPKKEEEGHSVPSYPEIHKKEEGVVGTPNKAPDDIVSKALSKPVVEERVDAISQNSIEEAALVYKIQIGVFRNKPDQLMLDKLSDVTNEIMEGSGLAKYYSGRYSTYKEAIENVKNVREVGFEGAFVVAFNKGEKILITKARDLEDID